MAERLELEGKKFGRLTVISRAENKRSNTAWNCICECGNEKVIVGYSLTSGKSKSCGCIQKEVAADRLLKHGHDRIGKTTREYQTWVKIIDRCENENNKDFVNYGGRGIMVCERWRNSFENFLSDMGKRPSSKHSIDRIDVNGDYEPSNCRWTTKEIQARNTRLYSTNKTGVRGVHFDKARNKYRSEIAVFGKIKYLGIFETIEEASKVRKEAEQIYWNEDNL